DGWSFRWTSRIPRERGLGSSASVIALGLVAASLLQHGRTDPGELFALGLELEGHGDNLAAALVGGVCLTWEARIVRVADRPPERTLRGGHGLKSGRHQILLAWSWAIAERRSNSGRACSTSQSCWAAGSRPSAPPQIVRPAMKPEAPARHAASRAAANVSPSTSLPPSRAQRSGDAATVRRAQAVKSPGYWSFRRSAPERARSDALRKTRSVKAVA